MRNLFSDITDENAHEEPTRPSKPGHIPDQRRLIHSLFESDERVWLLFLDGGRYDMFDQLVWDYFDGELQRAWNGGVGYTGDWFERNMRYAFDGRGLFSWLPIRVQQGNYDGRNYFKSAPDIGAKHNAQDRLATLGYREQKQSHDYDKTPAIVNAAVTEQRETVTGGVIRYLKPHPPFESLADLTAGTSKTAETTDALTSGKLTYDGLTDAYRETYETALWYAQQLISELEGRVILTADHGTCLTCGQLFHGRHHDKHDHLTIVPWFEVDDIV